MSGGEKRAREEVETLLAQTKLLAWREKSVKDKIRAIANNMCGKEVDFYGAGLGDSGVKAVAQALKDNTCLNKLDLNYNAISDAGASALAEMLKHNATMPTLYLHNNSIGGKGAVALAEMLKHNTTMTSLILGINPIGDEGAVALAEVLKHNTTMTTLGLGQNSIGDPGAVALAEMLKHNTALDILSLRKNSITPAGGAALGAALDQNRTLKRLWVCKNSPATARAFGAALPVDREIDTGDWSQHDTTHGDQADQRQGAAADNEQQPHEYMLTACKAGNVAAVTSLVEQDHADVDQQDEQGDTPLHVACRHNQPAIVKLLLEKGADASVKNKQGETPHYVATASGHTAITSIEGLNPGSQQQQQNTKDPRASTPSTKPKQEITAASDPEQGRKERLQQHMREIIARFNATMASRAKLIFIGQGRAGKTSTFHSLMGHMFNKHEHSTHGAATTDLAVIVESMDVHDWQELDAEISELMRSLCGTALVQESGVDLQMKQAMMKAKADLESRVAQHQHQQRQQEAEKAEKATGSKSKKEQLQNAKETRSRPSSRTSPATVPKPSKPSHMCASAPKKQTTLNPSSQSDAAARDNSTTATTGMSAEEMEKAIKEFNVDAVMGEGKARVTFKVFDLGGQSTFYIFHPFFLTKYAVYLLVFSMEDLLHQDESKRTETWEFMEHWLSSLHLHAKGAPVLIVGTFADVVSQRKQHENISRGIYSRLRHNPAFPGVIHNEKHGLWFWPVDNTQSIHDPMIQDLRQTISSTALAQEYVSQEVAVPYLHLYDKLNAIARDEKRPLLTFDEVVEIAHTCGLRTRQETKACLQFLHLYSMVLYYDSVPGMDDYVILSPQWAVDTMTRVIRNFDLHHDVRDGEARAVGAQLWDDLVDRGILHRRLLDVLWKDLEGGTIEPFLQLMMEYGLCVDYTAPMVRLSSPQQQQHHHQQFLVPAILPMTLEDEQASSSVTLSTAAAQQANPYAGYEEKTAYVAFSLREFKRGVSAKIADTQQASFLPEGLFPMVLARVMAHMQHGATEPPMLSRTDAVIFMDVAEIELQLVPAVGGIKIKVMTARPRTLLHMLYDTITTAVTQRYPELKATLLLPFNDTRLLFFEDVHTHHMNKKALRVGRSQLLSPGDLVAKYGPLLPVMGQQGKYDAFISYRQRGNRGLVMTLYPKLEQHGLVTFVDANNLETGVNFKHACMTALHNSAVACPVVSVGAIHQMRSLGHTDTCDNVLLEWMAMLELQQLARQHPDNIRLRRIVPLFVGSGWHDSNHHVMSAAEVSEYDSFDRLKRLATKLPDVVSKETASALDQFFSQVLRLPPPQRHKSVRKVVLSLFDIDAVIAVDAGVDRTSQLRDIAEKVRQVIVSARSEEHAVKGPAAARRSTQSSSSISTATARSTPPPATPSSPSSSAFEPELIQWLNRRSLLPHVEAALMEHGIDTLEDLLVLVELGELTLEMLKTAGVKVGKAIKLLRLAKEQATSASHALSCLAPFLFSSSVHLLCLCSFLVLVLAVLVSVASSWY
ncbi:hypothetical protein PTSG_11050 [Salpingoeca rosetta]|uniref:non-specific serine/threonine protein kinase n=1 Tax=Salpingoeca rosetta (strain ATCC 50818 / BSB-021) TaxID=946362 RepID=F2US00_SALR5|nr:uncharacterized protein PTSG_11050 [Salpingoeca rosetta]EGD80405.1 hypothetical protein PTSG_11050 [Salpingoeca rosetta]|eukprot:XP_004987969.1 hypothetical protein PTSG_11050 [Salpingoeca rosetta]